MAVIGIDSSGKIDQLPCFMVASRNPSAYCIRVTEVKQSHKSIRRWKERLTAVYAFRAVKKLYRNGDMVEFDDDFAGSKDRFKKFLDCLLNAYYGKKIETRVGRLPVSSSIGFADNISRYMRRKPEKTDETNPEISRELKILEGC